MKTLKIEIQMSDAYYADMVKVLKETHEMDEDRLLNGLGVIKITRNKKENRKKKGFNLFKSTLESVARLHIIKEAFNITEKPNQDASK